MMGKSTTNWIVLSAMYLTITTATVCHAQGLVDNLPASTIAWLRITDFAEFQKGYEQSAAHSAFYSSDFKPFSSAWRDILESDNFAKQFGVKYSTFSRIVQGEVIFAWIQTSPEDIAAVTIFETASTETVNLLKDAAKELAQLGMSVSESQNTITARDPQSARQLIFATSGQVSMFCDDAAIPQMVSHPQRRLSEQPNHQYLMKHLAAKKTNAMWFLDPWKLIKAQKNQPENLELLQQQGLAAIDSAAGVVTLQDNEIVGYEVVVHKSKLVKAAEMLRMEPIQAKIPHWIPRDTVTIQATGVVAQNVLNGYGSWFDATEGEGDDGVFESVLNDVRDEPDGPKIDLRADLVAQLKSPLWMLRFAGGPNNQQQVVFASETKDPETVRNAVAAMMSSDPDIRTIQVDDTPAWEFKDLTLGGSQEVVGPDLTGVTICVYKNALLVARNRSALDTLIRGSQDGENPFSATADTELQEYLSQHQVTSPVGFRFSRHADWLRRAYDGIRDANFNTDSIRNEYIATTMEAIRDRVADTQLPNAFSKLPDADTARKYVGDSIDVVRLLDDDGWLLKGTIKSPSHP